MTTQQFVFKIADIVKVTDGDSVWIRCDVGFRHWALVNIRLLGWDTPEKNSKNLHERNEAKVAMLMTSAFLSEGPGQLWVRTEKDPDSFGRWLGDIWREDKDDERHLGDALAHEGLATPWPMRWRERYLT
jgi:endonuclease YncB( thermonuclease family)